MRLASMLRSVATRPLRYPRELDLSYAYKMHPLVGPQIARGETESLEYMGLRSRQD